MRPLAWGELALARQRGHLFTWVPVCLAVGIGAYFGLRTEPPAWIWPYVVAGIFALALAAVLLRSAWSALPWALTLMALGSCLAAARAHLVEGPVLGWRYYGPVEGRVVGIDRSSSDAMRITLEEVVLPGVDPVKRPERVRISLHGSEEVAPGAGERVMVTAHLGPPGGPVEPGGFDFRRHAWFQKLGAVGYARTPLLRVAAAEEMTVLRARMALSARVKAGLDGETGAFAAAIMTGDRSTMSRETLADLRATNLAHLLAISGLHMGFLTGFVFVALRLSMNAWPALGLRIPVKKIAAVGALCAAAGYLALSGGNVATERAFVMAAVALLAVIADRRVISLRSVALAALIVLLLRPEALLGPGFQMSFAATAALVAVFSLLRDYRVDLGPRWFRPMAAMAISSAVAGAATLPIGAAHFNQVAHFGLVANLASVPLMGVLVIPSAVMAAVLMPFGLEALALWLMGLGLDWILGVAAVVAEMEGTRGAVPSPDWRVLPLMGIGFAVLLLWQGRSRFAGVVPVAVGLVLWVTTPRPDLLIAETGSLVGVMAQEGRALSKPRGSGFIALNWLENDGDPATQEQAAKRWQVAALPTGFRHVTGKRAVEALSCKAGELIVTNRRPPEGLPCAIYDPERLRKSGALALYWQASDAPPKIVSARDITGTRLWNRDQ